MTDPLRILMSSDHHFGAPTMNQEHMAKAFAQTIFPLLTQTDIFFINGDFFDTLVNFDNHGFDPIADTIFNLFKLCEEHHIVLRVLQGTWTHDRNQLKRWQTFYRNTGCSFDYRFAEGVELEEILVKDRSLRILFVPDDLPFTSSEDVMELVNSKLKEKGWDQIDYACMHGFFDFTYHKNASQQKVVVYQESQFDFVSKLVDVGHVHQYRQQGKIVSNGSFDRGCFGDEAPKGCIRILDYGDHYTAHFVENKNAAVYDTLTFSDVDTTQTIREKIGGHLQSIDSWRKISIRCVTEGGDHDAAIKDWMKQEYPDVRIVVVNKKDVSDVPQVSADSVLFTEVEKWTSPTVKTVATFIKDFIPEDYPLTVEEIDAYLLQP